MEKTNKLIVLQGLPASGKSTKAREMVATNPTGTIIVSRDAIRHACGQYWVPSREDYISKVETYMVRHGLEMGYNVIIDATNMHPGYIDKWTRIATEEQHVPIEFILINTPLEQCIERDRNADREHQVGEKVIRDFYERYKHLLS